MASDIYYTLKSPGQAKYIEKMSRFLSFAFPVSSESDARGIIKKFQNDYHDARHVCWAYMIGPDRLLWQLSDNGEPSGTAGKPILGQINSLGLTDVLVVVVRYFGGIKLGTPGLIAAYRQAARDALEDGGMLEKCRMTNLKIEFPYVVMDSVMKIIKSNGLEIISKEFEMICKVVVLVPESSQEEIVKKMGNIESISVEVTG